MQHGKTVIVICGPTASGKTRLAVRLAQHLQTSIISADSRQCYKELNVGVAKPSSGELAAVKHYFIGSHSIQNNINTKVFEEYALQKANEIFQATDYCIVCGGTGLYIKAFCGGIDEIPDVPASIRQQIIDTYQQKGLPWLLEEVQKNDAGYLQHDRQNNPQRLMRALEVKTFTGKSILEFRQNKAAERPFEIKKIGIDLPKQQLYQNIHARVDKMIEEGLLNEVKSLHAFQHLNALQTVGYKELFDYLDGKITLQDAIEAIKTHTRQYAKRQLTWFRKYKEIQWINDPFISADELMGLITTG